jgi:hypothetical protein
MSPPKSLWYINEEGKLDCLLVRTGITNGSYTEILPLGNDRDIEGFRVILRERI